MRINLFKAAEDPPTCCHCLSYGFFKARNLRKMFFMLKKKINTFFCLCLSSLSNEEVKPRGLASEIMSQGSAKPPWLATCSYESGGPSPTSQNHSQNPPKLPKFCSCLTCHSTRGETLPTEQVSSTLSSSAHGTRTKTPADGSRRNRALAAKG